VFGGGVFVGGGWLWVFLCGGGGVFFGGFFGTGGGEGFLARSSGRKGGGETPPRSARAEGPPAFRLREKEKADSRDGSNARSMTTAGRRGIRLHPGNEGARTSTILGRKKRE